MREALDLLVGSFDRPERPATGWLALLGGGEFSFGETLDADAAWLEHAAPGPVGFVPAASGSQDYARHFGEYLASGLAERLGKEALPGHRRELEVVPVYRDRDARRGKNAERIAAVAAVYLGGGVCDHLLDALADSPALTALEARLWGVGGVVSAIAAAAQACGSLCRSVTGGATLPGFGWVQRAVIDTNFDPAHDRRLRRALAAAPDGSWGLALPAGSAVLLGPAQAIELVGTVFLLADADADLVALGGE